MIDVIGAVIAIILILFLCSPIVLAVYMWNAAKIDIDNDGVEDLPNRW
jgi:hypothetical protein